jgi:ribosomal protein S27E
MTEFGQQYKNNDPGCEHHVSPGEPMYLHSRCHVDVPLTWTLVELTVLRVWCPKCRQEAGRFRLASTPYPLTCNCQGDASDFGWPRTYRGNPTLELVCYFCGKIICQCAMTGWSLSEPSTR